MLELVDHSTSETPPLPGFRLDKLEIYNWGTFDGAVYSVHPHGQTTLLVGENGSGKSTLVDALLTLLVRPQTRNYNLAAGATKHERDERTYIRGAYDRTIGQSGRPQIQYLRSGSGHYTALLAVFANHMTGASFTVCQVLYLNADNSVEKIYAMADGAKSIVADLSTVESATGIARHLRQRGFQTCPSYKQYFAWLQRKTGFRDKAMDVFNQTVAVKDVQRLDLFIRDHMLEAKPWKDKVERLLNHFSELSQAHRSLIRFRHQAELLQPIIAAGDSYAALHTELQQARKLLDASSLFFAIQTMQLLEPMCDQWLKRIEFLSAEIDRLDKLQDQRRDELGRINHDIEHAGSERLRLLPGLIEQAERLAQSKREARLRFDAQLATAGLQLEIASPNQFQQAQQTLAAQRNTLLTTRQEKRELSSHQQFEIGSLTGQLDQNRSELAALQHRTSNLPAAMIELRDAMSAALGLSPAELPYAAELLAVSQEERQWESSIEQVLGGFARSLLVPSEHYARVSAFVETQHLRDAAGRGQRLVYLRIGRTTQSSAQPATDGQWLIDKLEFRMENPLAAWLRCEIANRYNYRACSSIEEFQQASGAAMTLQRHFKSGRTRHEKDDRARPDDRRGFVLGWDNRTKQQALNQAIEQGEQDLAQLKRHAQQLDTQLDQTTAAIDAVDQAARLPAFDAIDVAQHEFAASQYRLEQQQLEESSNPIKDLKTSQRRLLADLSGHKAERDQMIADRSGLQREHSDGVRLVSHSRRVAAALTPARHSEFAISFDAITAAMPQPLQIENLASLPGEITDKLRGRVEAVQQKLIPLAREVTSGMTRFLKKFPDEQSDLDAAVESLSSFQALHQRIAQEDLPQHEIRFKQRLNEKVLHEVGLLHGALENDRDEIRNKVEQLNSALRLLQWKPGTFMKLEASDCADREIQDFRRELTACLSDSLTGTSEANEATFVRIERLVDKLREEGSERWRQKVIDVRNWFNFAAREIGLDSGEARSYYDGGTGQSGGEKGKLAFLVLVAAIAYQYDLDPDAARSDRFHFVVVDEMFSRSDDQHAEYALDLFERFGLQLLIVAPLDAKARVTEPYVGTYLHVVKDKQTHRSELLSITAEQLHTHNVG